MFFDPGYVWKVLPAKGKCLCRTGGGNEFKPIPENEFKPDDEVFRMAQTVPEGVCRQVVLAASIIVIDGTRASDVMQLDAGRLLLERVFTAAPKCHATATSRQHATHALQWLLQRGLLVDDGVSPPVVADYLFQDLDFYSSDVIGIITTMVCRSARNRPIPDGQGDDDTIRTRMVNSASVHLRDLAMSLVVGKTGKITSS